MESRRLKIVSTLANGTIGVDEGDFVTGWGNLVAESGDLLTSPIVEGAFGAFISLGDSAMSNAHVAGQNATERFLIEDEELIIPGLRFRATIGIEADINAEAESKSMRIKVGHLVLTLNTGTAFGNAVYASTYLDTDPNQVYDFTIALAKNQLLSVNMAYAPKPLHQDGFAEVTISNTTDSQTLRVLNQPTPSLRMRDASEIEVGWATTAVELGEGEFIIVEPIIEIVKVGQ